MKNKIISNEENGKDDVFFILSNAPVLTNVFEKRRNSRSHGLDQSSETRKIEKEIKREGSRDIIKHQSHEKHPIKKISTLSTANDDIVPKRKHWRSPSNPIDFNINCTSYHLNNIRIFDNRKHNNNYNKSCSCPMNTSEFTNGSRTNTMQEKVH